MTKDQAIEFIECEEVNSLIERYVTVAFDNILVHFANNPELGYIRVNSPEEVNNLALTDFLELYYTSDDNFSKLYPKQTLYGEASLSKHFRSAIGPIVVFAVEAYLEVEENHLWHNEPKIFEACLNVAGKKYFDLMSFNDLYKMDRDFQDRMLHIMRLFG